MIRSDLRILPVIAVTVLLSSLSAGCITLYKDDQAGSLPSAGAKATTASLSEATMCKSVDPKTSKPVEVASVFSPATPVIYCSVKLSNAPPNTEVKAQWILSGTVLYEDVGKESGSYYLVLKLQPPKAGWPVGNYEVRLFVDGQQKLVVPFKVQ